MLHKAWNSKRKMPYYFPRSSIKFQGHTVQNITDFYPNRAFPDYRPVAAFKSLRFALLYWNRALLYWNRAQSLDYQFRRNIMHFRTTQWKIPYPSNCFSVDGLAWYQACLCFFAWIAKSNIMKINYIFTALLFPRISDVSRQLCEGNCTGIF